MDFPDHSLMVYELTNDNENGCNLSDCLLIVKIGDNHNNIRLYFSDYPSMEIDFDTYVNACRTGGKDIHINIDTNDIKILPIRTCEVRTHIYVYYDQGIGLQHTKLRMPCIAASPSASD